MKSGSEMLKKYIEQKIAGEDKGLDEYINEEFKNNTLRELKEYCKENDICLKHRGIDRENVLSRIYGHFNGGLGYKMIAIGDVRGESMSDFYKRFYDRYFK